MASSVAHIMRQPPIMVRSITSADTSIVEGIRSRPMIPIHMPAMSPSTSRLRRSSFSGAGLPSVSRQASHGQPSAVASSSGHHVPRLPVACKDAASASDPELNPSRRIAAPWRTKRNPRGIAAWVRSGIGGRAEIRNCRNRRNYRAKPGEEP